MHTVDMHQFALIYGAMKRYFMSRDRHVTTPSFLLATSAAAVPINAKNSFESSLVSKLIYTICMTTSSPITAETRVHRYMHDVPQYNGGD